MLHSLAGQLARDQAANQSGLVVYDMVPAAGWGAEADKRARSLINWISHSEGGSGKGDGARGSAALISEHRYYWKRLEIMVG